MENHNTSREPAPSRFRDGGKWRTVCFSVTVICCWLIHCTMGFTYSFGNLNPYLTSYLRNATTDIDYTDTLWIAQSANFCTCLLMPFVGLLSTRIPTKLYLFLGTLFTAKTCDTLPSLRCNGSTFGTYWSIQASFPITVLSYGILGGAAQAILYPAPVNIVARWTPSKVGLVSGLILTGYGLGAFLWNFLITWYINPHNLQPDVKIGEDMFYTQPEVLDKVPSCFLVLGCVFSGIQLLSLILVCEAPEPETHSATPDDIDAINNEDTAPLLYSDEEGTTGVLGLADGLDLDRDVLDLSSGDGNLQETPSSPTQRQYHPKELLKSRVFWTLWLVLLTTDLGTVFIITLFKAYGETFIPDDHFLSLVASFSSVFNAAGRPFWGLLADRIGPRKVALCCQFILVSLVGTFVTCEVTGRAAFFIWVCGMFLSMCGLFTMFPSLAYRLFGSQYFNANLGLLDSEGVFAALGAAVLAPILKDALGWHGVFYFSYGVLFLSLVLNMSLDIHCGNTIPRQMRSVLSLHRLR
ncbi:hypothetical protein BaRGS_00037542 [Batillaria attramentaria]|uniref:Major facilitator superfamily (MFS) profile domain-containing protein n=1 Tax=Batillaria attramentaria TaxID=370345 RepID=A0ABD0J8B1_9CAEN